MKLFILSQDLIFSFKLFYTLTPILDMSFSSSSIFLFETFFCLVLYSFPDKLLVRYDCIFCGNLLLNALFIIIQVCDLTSWNIVNMFRLRNNFEV